MNNYLFSIFMFFSYGILFYGYVVDVLFNNVAYKFNFYGIHYNNNSVMLIVILGFALTIVGRNFSNTAPLQSSHQTESLAKFIDIIKFKSVMAGIFLAIFFILVDGVTFMPERVGYRINDDTVLSTFLALSGLSGLFCIPLLALVWKGPSFSLKLISLLLFFAVLFCYFAKASRTFSLAPILYFVTAYYCGAKIFKYLIFAIILVTPISVSFILELRGQNNQGFIPFLTFLIEGNSEYDVYQLIGDFFVSLASGYYIFIETVNSAGWMNFKDLWVSISPSFGEASGWTVLFSDYRINDAVPYSSIGELIAFNFLFFFSFSFMIGCMFGRAESHLYSGRFIGFIQVAVLLFMAFQIPQYNLRSIMRYFYLVGAIELIYLVHANIINKKMSILSIFKR